MSVTRSILRALIVTLQAALLVWLLCLPLAWLLRDGLGPDSRETGWALAISKAAISWGIPALALALPLFGLTWVDRRWRGGKA